MSKLLMIVSAGFMAALGVILTFAPHEVIGAAQGTQHAAMLPAMQLLGALYLGGATTNWMSKSNLVGGIFGRPLAMGNLGHFAIGAMALMRFAAGTDARAWPLAIVYALLAAGFGVVIFSPPKAVAGN